MDFATFKKSFTILDEIPSKTGRASYHAISVSGNNLHLTRKETGSNETISLTELYEVYQNQEFINTTILRNHITGRVYSPALAVLTASGFYDKDGNRIKKSGFKTQDITPPSTKKVEPAPIILKSTPAKKEDDEARFFRILNDMIGDEFLQAKSIGKLVDKDLLDLPGDYRKLSYKPGIMRLLHKIAETLGSDFDFGNTNLNGHIDGLIIDHPVAGTRIVEFDEEQHFTPPRKFSITILSEGTESRFYNEYLKICNDTAYLNKEVFPKHRISAGMRTLPANIGEFRSWIEQHAKISGFVEAKNGFPYFGGRISQRAWYDSLRDVAHLAGENDHLSPILRFAKKTFENECRCSFRNISDENLAATIINLLWRFYDIKIQH